MRCTEERQRCTTFWHPTKMDFLKSQLATQCSIQNDYWVIFREIVPCGALRKDKGELPSDSQPQQIFSKISALLNVVYTMTIQWSFEKSYHAVHWGNARVTYPLTCNYGINSQKSARYSLWYIQLPYSYLFRNRYSLLLIQLPYSYLFRNLPVRCTEKRQGWSAFWQPTTIDILKSQLATKYSISNDYTVIFWEIFSCGAPRNREGKLHLLYLLKADKGGNSQKWDRYWNAVCTVCGLCAMTIELSLKCSETATQMQAMTIQLSSSSFEKSYREALCLLRRLSLHMQVCLLNRVVYMCMRT